MDETTGPGTQSILLAAHVNDVVHLPGGVVRGDAHAPPPAADPREAPVEVRPHRFGRGVYARRRIEAGETVLTGRGEYVERSIHSFQVGPDTHVRIANEIELINHSCEPNCGILLPLNSREMRVVAMRAIEPDEEITTDYATHDYEIRFMPERCHCGTALCRGRVTGYRDLPPERRAAYGRHIAEYLPPLDLALRGGGSGPNGSGNGRPEERQPA